MTKMLRWKIKQPVGKGLENQGADVRQIISLLNMIGSEFGGTFEFPLPASNRWNHQLERAVIAFQQASLNPLQIPTQEKGAVFPESETIRQLNALAGRFGFGERPRLHPVRRRILEIAKREQNVVTDRTPADEAELVAYNQRFGTSHQFQAGKYRKGMARLRDYFTNTVTQGMNFSERGLVTNTKFDDDASNDTHVELTKEEGIIYHNRRPPMGRFKTPYYKNNKPTKEGYYNGFHWCGVFAAWVVQQAGMVNVKWSTTAAQLTTATKSQYNANSPSAGPGPHQQGTLLSTMAGFRERKLIANGQIPIRPGDILVLNNKNNHHVILLDYKITDKTYYKGYFTAIGGNSEYQEVAINQYPLDKFYRIYHTWPG